MMAPAAKDPVRGGKDLMLELGYRPTNTYLPPWPRRGGS